jgi:hypothetical protein
LSERLHLHARRLRRRQHVRRVHAGAVISLVTARSIRLRSALFALAGAAREGVRRTQWTIDTAARCPVTWPVESARARENLHKVRAQSPSVVSAALARSLLVTGPHEVPAD